MSQTQYILPMSKDPRYVQLLALTKRLNMPSSRYLGDVIHHDRAALERYPERACVVAVGSYGTVLYWPHLDDNPWVSLGAYLRSVQASTCDAHFFLLGATPEPIEFGPSPSIFEVDQALKEFR